MKLSVMQENLARGLQVVSRAVSTRSTLPVLNNVLLRTEDGGLKLTATNLEIGMTYWVPGKIDVDGSVTVPARLLADIVLGMPANERVDLELLPQETLHVKAGRFETRIKGIDAEEFPAIPTAGEKPTTRVAQKVLREALGEVTFAAAADEARPILTGVLAKFEGTTLTLAAADNYRIAVKTITVLDAVEDTSIVVPARSLHELSRILSDTDDPIDIVLSPARNQILFHLEGIDLVSRLIDGQFPNYQQVMPKSPHHDRDGRSRPAAQGSPAGQPDRQLLGQHRQDAHRQGRRDRADRQRRRRHRRQPAATSRPRSRATAPRSPSTPGTWWTSCRTSPTEQFSIELNGPLSPGVFRPVGDGQYVHVVMPVKTTS